MGTGLLLVVAVLVIAIGATIVDLSRRPYKKARARLEHQRYKRELAQPVPPYKPLHTRRRHRSRIRRMRRKVRHPVRSVRRWWRHRPYAH